MSSICLVAGLLSVALGPTVTLRWTHSIEKIIWEEDYRASSQGLLIEQARIQGSGAGMEPPDGAELRDGVWHYRPDWATLGEVKLMNSSFTAAYTLCSKDRCLPFDGWLQGLAQDTAVTLRVCP